MRTPPFMLVSLLALAGLALVSPTGADAVTFTHGVASGEVTHGSAVLWTRVDLEAALTVEVSTDPRFEEPTLTETRLASADSDFTARVIAAPLSPSQQYFFRWRDGASVSEVGTFRTAPLPSAPAAVRFAWTGDSDPSRIGGVPAFNNWETLDAVRREDPDFFVYLGDTIYSDFRAGGFLPDAQSLDDFRALYKAGRDYTALRDLARATSMYALWDDHEVRNDWDGATVDPFFLEIGRQSFFEYMPLTEKRLPHDPDCAADPLFRVVRWGREVDVIILDVRSCRSASVEAICLGDLAPTMPQVLRAQFPAFFPPQIAPGCLEAIDDPSRTMLGRLQKERLKAALVSSRARFKVAITGVNIQQLYILPYDTWEGYAAERAEILNFIRDQGIRNVIFLTTDGHQNVMKGVFIDRFTDPVPLAYEAMTGPIATVTWQNLILGAIGPLGVVAQQAIHTLLGADCRHLNAYSYGVVRVDPTTGSATITLKDSAGNALHDQLTPTTACTRTIGP